jgi:hypothetical protein
MENKISTIQLNQAVKRRLQEIKQKPNESYEEAIVKLLDEKQKKKEETEKLLREECEEFAEEYLKINEEFKYVDAEMNKYAEWDDSDKS